MTKTHQGCPHASCPLVLVAAVLACSSGRAKPDWIRQTLVTVDVTGTWWVMVATSSSSRTKQGQRSHAPWSGGVYLAPTRERREGAANGQWVSGQDKISVDTHHGRPRQYHLSIWLNQESTSIVAAANTDLCCGYARHSEGEIEAAIWVVASQSEGAARRSRR